MGKGISWSAKERECAALAWFRAMNNATVVGADQRMEDFQNKIFSIFKVLAPTTYPVQQGTYEHRTPTAVYYSCLKDIFTDIGNFYKALTLVNNSNPTGVNADNKLSMAIAIHAIKEVNRLNYNYRDYDHYKWVNYLAWKVLRYSPKYHPPSPPSTNMDKNDNTSPLAIDSVLMAESPFLPDLATTNTAILQMSTNQNSSPETVAASTSTISNFSMAESSSAAVGHDSNMSSSTSSKKRAFVPADPALGGRGAEMGQKKAEEIKEKRYNELKEELSEQTKTQKRLVCLFELRTLIKTATMTKNKKLLKDANDEMAKFLGGSTNDNDAEDDNDDDFPPMIPRAGV
jgi:hypothetical protein